MKVPCCGKFQTHPITHKRTNTTLTFQYQTADDAYELDNPLILSTNRFEIDTHCRWSAASHIGRTTATKRRRRNRGKHTNINMSICDATTSISRSLESSFCNRALVVTANVHLFFVQFQMLFIIFSSYLHAIQHVYLQVQRRRQRLDIMWGL